MTKYEFCLVSSLYKVLPDEKPETMRNVCLSGFWGETVSVQIAYSCQNDDLGESDSHFRIRTQSELSDITLRRVELVPCAYPCHGTRDEDYLVTRPGLYPDLLLPLEKGQQVRAIAAQWRSIWVDVSLKRDMPDGIYGIEIFLEDKDGNVLEKFQIAVRVHGIQLPPQRLIHTQWFHCDCLADYYHVPVFSEEHWRIVENFIKSVVRNGVNMILTPVFTPPLDTSPGKERTTVQLVEVSREGDCWRFGFERLARWISLCEACGIRYLEISHLFTQWGAVSAPKIVGTVDGGPPQKLFGWHTPAVGGEYTRFLHAFLPELKAFLRECKWLERTWFHISDEPHESEMESFAQAKRSVEDVLEGCQVMDALSSFALYQRGFVQRPVASVDHIGPFLEARVFHLWAYYCTAQALAVPNRFIAMPSTRNRILGVLLYYFRIEGFLHWGFNFYNSQRSEEHIDPYRVTMRAEPSRREIRFWYIRRRTGRLMIQSAGWCFARHSVI